MTTDTPPPLVEGAPRLFVFGLGYSARALVARWQALPVRGPFAGTSRSPDGAHAIEDMGGGGFVFNREDGLDAHALEGATHVLVSIPPDADGDAVADLCGDRLARLEGLTWLGYLSTTGVYGDTAGRVVDESAACVPTSVRSQRRKAAEDQWLALHATHDLPVHIFRLPGIYGPGRSPFDRVRAGRAPIIDKPGHLFSRIHVDDIAETLLASMARPNPGAIYNVADDEAAAPGAVTRLAYELLGETPPAPIAFADAEKNMSAMQRSFWNDNRQVSNRRIQEELGVRLRYPTYREGLPAVLAAEGQRGG